MDREEIIILLQNIKANHYIGVSTIEIVYYTIKEGFIDRTMLGNFKLTQKGEEFLNSPLQQIP